MEKGIPCDCCHAAETRSHVIRGSAGTEDLWHSHDHDRAHLAPNKDTVARYTGARQAALVGLVMYAQNTVTLIVRLIST
eukprot:651054-Amphidinium_carterae.1